MKKVVSVSFKGNNKKYYFEAIDNLKLKDKVVVETQRGLELATIVETIKEIDDEEVIGSLKPIIRKASEKDVSNYEYNQKLKPELFKKCSELIEKSKFEMKLVDCEYTLDKTKLVLYFTADGRIDFRDLVKDIASFYHTRIELRQVGPRDASRVIGGIGECGREVCCKSFLGDIQNVTIKMAKNQNLSLNPSTISGLCGKLLCCISYEDQDYHNVVDDEANVQSSSDLVD